MALVNRRSRRPSIDIWPGFVDALAQLLMVIIFILLVFTAGQFFLADALTGRDKALRELQQQVSELSNLLALERTANTDLRASAASLAAQLKATESERNALAARAKEVEKALTGEQQTSTAARAQVEQLTASVAALREQLAQVAAALDLAEAKAKDQQTQLADLGRRLNLALASKVEELCAAARTVRPQAGCGVHTGAPTWSTFARDAPCAWTHRPAVPPRSRHDAGGAHSGVGCARRPTEEEPVSTHTAIVKSSTRVSSGTSRSNCGPGVVRTNGTRRRTQWASTTPAAPPSTPAETVRAPVNCSNSMPIMWKPCGGWINHLKTQPTGHAPRCIGCA